MGRVSRRAHSFRATCGLYPSRSFWTHCHHNPSQTHPSHAAALLYPPATRLQHRSARARVCVCVCVCVRQADPSHVATLCNMAYLAAMLHDLPQVTPPLSRPLAVTPLPRPLLPPSLASPCPHVRFPRNRRPEARRQSRRRHQRMRGGRAGRPAGLSRRSRRSSPFWAARAGPPGRYPSQVPGPVSESGSGSGIRLVGRSRGGEGRIRRLDRPRGE